MMATMTKAKAKSKLTMVVATVVVAATVAVALLVAGCSFPGLSWRAGQKEIVRTADAAVKAVFEQDKTDDWRLSGFQPAVGKVVGKIPRGGLGNVSIDGTYETKVTRDGPDWTVSLTEAWDARDFHESHSPAAGTLSHTWQVRVDAKTGQVSWIDDMGTGDFPPQLVR